MCTCDRHANGMQIPDVVVHNFKAYECWNELRIADTWSRAHRQLMGGGKKLAGARVLIVEDNFLIAEQLSRLIQDEGRRLWGRSPLRKGRARSLEAGRSTAPFSMSAQREESTRVAQLLEERHVPFLVLTGYEREFISNRFSQAPYVSKPFCEKSLVALASETFGTA